MCCLMKMSSFRLWFECEWVCSLSVGEPIARKLEKLDNFDFRRPVAQKAATGRGEAGEFWNQIAGLATGRQHTATGCRLGKFLKICVFSLSPHSSRFPLPLSRNPKAPNPTQARFWPKYSQKLQILGRLYKILGDYFIFSVIWEDFSWFLLGFLKR